MKKRNRIPKKAGVVSPLVAEIIIAAIAVSFAVLLFGGFALPFMEFLADQDNIKSFNNLMSGFSQSCKEGTYTVPQIKLTLHSERKIYAISTANIDVAEAFEALPECKFDSTETCTTSASASRVAQCKYQNCYCLYKIVYDKKDPSLWGFLIGGKTPPYCSLYNYNTITIPSENDMALWNEKFVDAINNIDYPIKSIIALQCNAIEETSCTFEDEAGNLFVHFASIGKRPIVWIQPNIINPQAEFNFLGITTITISQPGLALFNLRLDSMSFHMPRLEQGYARRVEVTSNPDLVVFEYDMGEPNPIANDERACYIGLRFYLVTG